MDNRIENIIVISNTITVTKEIVKKVGFEFQAPLDDATLDEIITSVVMKAVESKTGGQA